MSSTTDTGAGAPIAYICSAYPAISHVFVLREVLALRRLGVDVHTFSVRRTSPGDLLSDADRAEAARTHHLLPTTAWRVLRATGRLLANRRGRTGLGAAAREAWRLRRPGARAALWQGFYLVEAILLHDECARRSIRHIHAHFANVASDVALLTAALGTAPAPDGPWTWSFTMHGPAEFWNVREHRLAEKVQSASFVACISEFARSQLMSLSPEATWQRLHVVHCGVEPGAYGRERPAALPGDGRARLVTIGRLVPAKGQLLVVDVVAALRGRGIEVCAEIIGEGPARPDLERRIHELGLDGCVTLAGAISQDEVPGRLQAATVFVLPSFAEGVPVVAMEAMALGVPVVASRIAGIPELIEDGVSGLLTTPSRIDEVVDATERLIRDPELRARIVAAGREAVASGFDVSAQARRLIQLIPGQNHAGILPAMPSPKDESHPT